MRFFDNRLKIRAPRRSSGAWCVHMPGSRPPLSHHHTWRHIGDTLILQLPQFFNDGGRAHVQHPRRITNAARIHSHIDNLLLDIRGLPGVGIFQEKRTPPLRTRATPVALLAFRRRTMSHNIRALAVGTVQHLRNHCCSLSHRWLCSAQTLIG